MKIIHCADLHLDSEMESNLNKDQARIRRRELLDTFERMCEYARNEKVSAILISGDMFDRTHVRREAKKRVLEQITLSHQVQFFYIKGNHDRNDFLEDGEDVPDNLHLFEDERWISYKCDDVVITGLELNEKNALTIGSTLILNQADCNIVMLHGQQSDYFGKDKAEIINIQALKNKYIDYLALGHIHRYEHHQLDDRGVFCYSGCLEGRGFDEIGDKGFVLLEITDGKITSEFIPFAKRRLHEIQIDVSEDMQMPTIIYKCQEACEDVDSVDLIKLVIAGNRRLNDEIDTDRIVSRFERDYFFVKCYDRTKKLIDYDSFMYDKSLKGEFVRLMKKKDMDENTRSKIVELGIRAIMGEDI